MIAVCVVSILELNTQPMVFLTNKSITNIKYTQPLMVITPN